MCTVSIAPLDAGFRLVCNRDELLTRPQAEFPAVHALGATTAIWPRDPEGGGTWIAVNDAGLAFVLLNRAAHTQSAKVFASRGLVIPDLSSATSLQAAINGAMRLPAEAFQEFMLLIVDCRRLAVVTNTGDRLWLEGPRARQMPVMFTSSALGDHIARAPRQALFSSMVIGGTRLLEDQASFHRHKWPDRPEISIEMAREDAATVSRTVVDVHRGSIGMCYTPLRR